MVDVTTLLGGSHDHAWLEGQAELVCAKLSTPTQPSFTIVSLIESLGPALTHTTTSVRQSGLTIVTLVLDSPSTQLHKEDAGLLTLFYTDRLRDHHSLLPATLQGLAALARCENLSFEHLEKLLNSVFTEVMVQQQVVKDRSTVFTMLVRLLRDRLDDIKSLATQFTVGFLQAFEGEKDPRNLLLIFSTVASMLDILPLSHLREDAFESLAVYFPVDFTPPSGLAGSVTKLQLVEGLRHGLSHPSLAEWTIGLLLEKLEADLESAKIDSLQTLLELVNRCGERNGEGMEIWAREVEGVWAALKKETMGIRMQPSKEVMDLAREAVKEVSRMLGSKVGLGTPDQDLAWTRWIDRLWDDCRIGLGQPNTRLMGLAGGVLGQMARGGERQAIEVLSLAIPSLYKTWEDHTGQEARRAVVEVTGTLLQGGGVSGVKLEQEWVDKMFAVFLTVIAAGGADGVMAGVTMARAAGVVGGKQQAELAMGLVDGVRRGEKGMGTALANLAFWNKDLVEKEAIPKLLEMDGAGLDALGRLWEAGFYPHIVPVLVDRLVTGKMATQQSATFLGQLAEYSLTAADKKCVEPADLLIKLVHCSDFKDDDNFMKVLAGLGELLTVDNCGSVSEALSGLEIKLELGCISSVASSVSVGVLREWSTLVDKIIELDMNEEHIWRLKTSFVNKCPTLAEKMILTDDGEGVGWISIGLARRGDGLATPWIDRLVAQLSLPGDVGSRSVQMVARLLAPSWWRQPVTGLLYIQRVWAQLQPKLSSGASENHLAALVLLLPYLPKALLVPSLPTLLPKVVKALSSTATVHSALSCLADITKSSPTMVSSHLVELVHHCLDISKDSPLRSRILALTVLAYCSKIEGPTSVQLSAKVTKDLAIPLKDRKRVVRVQAAKTRNLWFLVTQPS